MVRLPENIAKSIVRPNVVVEFYADSPTLSVPSAASNDKLGVFRDFVDTALQINKFAAYAFVSLPRECYYNRPLWIRSILPTDHYLPLQIDDTTRKDIAEHIARVFADNANISVHAVVRIPTLQHLAPYY